MEPHLTDISRVIQLAVAPVFLLTAIATLINSLNARLGRIVDRRRVVQDRLHALAPGAGGDVGHEITQLARRSRLVYYAIFCAVLAALLVCLVVAGAFLGALLGVRAVAALCVLASTVLFGHLAELVQAYFHHRPQLTKRIKLRYVVEDEPTGTAGSLALVPGLRRTFLAMNGDLLTDLNLDELVAFHRKQKAVLTIATHQRHVKIDLGVLKFDDNFRLTAYAEKPENTYHVSMGVYVYEPRVLRFIEPGKYLDFPNLVLKLIAAGEKVCAFPTDCLWLDIGRPDDYARAQELFAEKPEKFEHV